MPSRIVNDSPVVPKRGFFYGWIIVGATFLIVFSVMGAYYTFGVFFKPMSGELGWTRAQTSLAVTINMIVGGFVAVLIGRLADKHSPRSIMLPCAVLAGVGYVLMSRVSALWQLYLIYGLVLGIAMSAHYIIPSVLINRWFIKKRGLGLGLVFSAFGLAQTSFPPLAASLVEGLGWRQIYVYTGAIVLVITVVAALFLRGSPGEMGLLPDGEVEEKDSQAKKSDLLPGLTLKEALRTSTFWLLTTLWFLMAIPVYIMIVHLIPYSTDVGMGTVAAASILTVTGVSNIGGRISLGHISDKIGAKLILLLCFVMVIIGMVILIYARSLLTFYLAGILFSFFLSGADNVVIKVVGDFFGLRALGFIVGVTSVAWRGGAALGAYLAGLIFDVSKSYAWAFALSAFVMGLCFILTLFMFARKPRLSATAASE